MSTLQADSSRFSIAVFAKRLFTLERTGEFGKALKEISENWSDAGFRPTTAGMSEKEGAELMLRYAALLGFHGHNLQIADSQQRSRDILTDAKERFLCIEAREKARECENYIALSYWRTGELNEALVWIESIEAETSPEPTATMLYTRVIRSLVLLSLKRYEENIEESSSYAPVYFAFGDAFLTGSYCTNIGLSFKNVGRTDEALRYLELARDFHIASRHKIYLGTVENNLSQIHRTAGRFSKAHAAIDAATKAFRQARDRTREGFSLDTKALVYMAEGEFALALKSADTAAKILRKGVNAAYFVEALQTKSRIQIYLDDLSGAVATLLEAINIARLQIGDECVDKIFEQFRIASNERAEARSSGSASSEQKAPGGDLQLVLPNSLARFDDYQGIWMSNSHLEPLGLKKGTLAVIARDEIKRGDLVAISENDTDMVSCGFYDEEFGIVCLEGVNAEPQLFNKEDVKILGKIVGVCSGQKDKNGKMRVEPLVR